MNRLTRMGMAAVLVAVSVAAFSQAVTKAASQADANKAIEARQAIFKKIKEFNDPVGAMIRPNGPPVDPALAAANMAKIAELAKQIPAAFLVDTRGFNETKTAALDGIWDGQPDFKTKADALVTATTAAAEAGKTGDADATRTALTGIGRACGGCHQTYRAKL